MHQLVGEFFGTFILVLLGDGIVAGNLLKKSKAYGEGWLSITIGWGLAVTMGIYAVGWLSPAHINPAVTLGMAVAGEFAWVDTLPYMVAQVAGGFVGGIIVWLHYKPHFGVTEDQEAILSVFSTVPAIRNSVWNAVSEAIGTAVLVYGLLAFTQGEYTEGLEPLAVGLLIVAIGLSLGGTTGYAINPARDLGPRIAHQVLPIENKGNSDWEYAWVPIVGPLVGGILGAFIFTLLP